MDSYTKLSIETKMPGKFPKTITIEDGFWGCTAHDMLHDFFIPAMEAFGYHKESVIRAMKEISTQGEI